MVPHWLETDGFDGKKVRFYPDSGEPIGWESESGYLPALGDRYGDHPRFSYIDIRVMDAVYGEGQFQDALNKEKIDNLQDNYGYSPEAWESFMKSQFDLYSKVFSGQERKCVIQNFDVGQAGPPGFYEGAAERVWKYGLGKGFGGRDGQVENIMRYLNLGYGMCNNPADKHFMIFENSFPVFKAWEEHPEHAPVWLTENEEWGYDNNLGPQEAGLTGWFASNMRALQMRRSHIGISYNAVWLDLDFSRYLQLSCGKTRRTSPDAWCWLRQADHFGWMTNFPADTARIGTNRSAPEGGWLATNLGYPKEYDYLNWERGNQTFKNFERWHYQYDVKPDGRTRTAEPMKISNSSWSADQGRDPEKLYNQSHAGANNNQEYWARRTDQKSGNNAVYFKLEPRWFRNYSGPVQILVAFKDSDESIWQLEFDDLNGERQAGASITASNSNEWKTAVMTIEGLQAAGGFSEKNDFRLLRVGGGDLIVRLVRIIKLEEHAVSGVQHRNGPAAGFKLYPNSPNPFNPATLISYELPEGNRARVEVFDLLGRSIAVLVDEIQQAGYHQVRFVSDNLPSGAYFYRLTSGDLSAVCKMLLIQ